MCVGHGGAGGSALAEIPGPLGRAHSLDVATWKPSVLALACFYLLQTPFPTLTLKLLPDFC